MLNILTAAIDLMDAKANDLFPAAIASRYGLAGIPEYRPDKYDISGIRIYASSERQPLKRWDWSFMETDFYGILVV